MTVDFHGRSFSKAEALLLNLAALAGRGMRHLLSCCRWWAMLGRRGAGLRTLEWGAWGEEQPWRSQVTSPLRSPTMYTNSLNYQKPCASQVSFLSYELKLRTESGQMGYGLWFQHSGGRGRRGAMSSRLHRKTLSQKTKETKVELRHTVFTFPFFCPIFWGWLSKERERLKQKV